MAQFKPTDTTTPPLSGRNHRVDGVVYQMSPTSTGSHFTPPYAPNQVVTWRSPESRPTPRYEATNKKIIILDQQFEALSSFNRDLWEISFDLQWWKILCWVQRFDREALTPEDTED